MCQWRASVHYVRARTPPFACGGDDYLLVLFDGDFQVRAIASPAAVLAPAAAAIACAAVGMPCSAPHACPLPMALWQAVDCCFIRAQLLAAEVASDKWQIQKWPFAIASASDCGSRVNFVTCSDHNAPWDSL